MLSHNETDVVILTKIILPPLFHDHTVGAMRCASAASISDVELGATFKPTAVRVVTVDALMLIASAQVIAERHAACLNFPWCLVLAFLYFICEAWWALIFVLFLLLVLFFLLVIYLTLFLLLILRLMLLLIIIMFLLLLGLLVLTVASSLLFWSCH